MEEPAPRPLRTSQPEQVSVTPFSCGRHALSLRASIGHRPGWPSRSAGGSAGDSNRITLYRVVTVKRGSPTFVAVDGRHCEAGDRISTGVALRDPVIDDVVTVPSTGAYCFTLANNYNGARRPPVVFCRDGTARLVVRRESYDDMLRRDVADS